MESERETQEMTSPLDLSVQKVSQSQTSVIDLSTSKMATEAPLPSQPIEAPSPSQPLNLIKKIKNDAKPLDLTKTESSFRSSQDHLKEEWLKIMDFSIPYVPSQPKK